MNTHRYLCFSAIVLMIAGWATRTAAATDDVTIYKPNTGDTAAAGTAPATNPDGTPVIHKSSHRHKKSTAAATNKRATTVATNPDAAPMPTPSGTNAPPAKSSVTKNAIASASSIGAGAGTAPAVAASAKPPGKKKSSKTARKSAKTPPVLVVTPAPLVVPTRLVPVVAPVTHASVAVQSAPLRPSVAIHPMSAPVAIPPVIVPPIVPTTPASILSGAPVVETDLPVAREGASSAILNPTPIPSAAYAKLSHHPYVPFGSTAPSALSSFGVQRTFPGATSAFAPTAPPLNPNFKFADFDRRAAEAQTYPWKRSIITTIFWIGEGGSTVSSTTNVASAWDEDWRKSNSGSDSPDDMQGYVSGNHASTQNPFYVALPFNDLAFPDEARRWLPNGWYHPPRNGEKPTSACKNRWVEIKNRQGKSCFAQWEDVGPLRFDDAAYVFGTERPEGLAGHPAGLDVSPAVAKYLGVDGANDVTNWHFVDDSDVPPGAWLKYDEEAVLLQAMKSMKNPRSSEIPIQSSSQPIMDDSQIESNEKRVSGARG